MRGVGSDSKLNLGRLFEDTILQTFIINSLGCFYISFVIVWGALYIYIIISHPQWTASSQNSIGFAEDANLYRCQPCMKNMTTSFSEG